MAKRLSLIFALPLVLVLAAQARGQIAQSGGGAGGGGSVVTGNGLSGNGTGGSPLVLATPVTPANGGVGAMTSAPMWARFFGDGNEGAYLNNGTLTGEHWYTTFECNGAISAGSRNPLVIRATTSIKLDSNCILNFNAVATPVQVGFLGGVGGGGGGGSGTGTAAGAMGFLGSGGLGSFLGTPQGGTTGNPGGPGTGPLSLPNVNTQPYISGGLISLARTSAGNCGGSTGGAGNAGGSGAGTGGSAGSCVVLYAPSINIVSGAAINAQASNGGNATANNSGGGGGGGGGFVGAYAETFTGQTLAQVTTVGGGAGGACTTPALYVLNAVGDETGTGAILTVTGLTTGGLDASKITITNGGSGYTAAPSVVIAAGTSGLTGSPAAHATISGGAVASVVIDTAGSGGTLTTFTTCSLGGAGGPGWYNQLTIQ